MAKVTASTATFKNLSANVLGSSEEPFTSWKRTRTTSVEACKPIQGGATSDATALTHIYGHETQPQCLERLVVRCCDLLSSRLCL